MLREGRFGFILEMIRLNELFALLHIDCEDARILQGISDDTRDVKKGLALCLPQRKPV